MPFTIFRTRTLSASNAVGLLIGMSLFSMFFFVSLYMQGVLRFDALETGLAYLPLALTIIVSAGVASQLVTRLGFKPVLMFGLLLVAAGLLWFSQVSVGGSLRRRRAVPVDRRGRRARVLVRPGDHRRGAGTKEEESGLASGLINTSQQIGGALGLAILSTIAFNNRPRPAAATRRP